MKDTDLRTIVRKLRKVQWVRQRLAGMGLEFLYPEQGRRMERHEFVYQFLGYYPKRWERRV